MLTPFTTARFVAKMVRNLTDRTIVGDARDQAGDQS
jgi:hypothetical protein